MNTSQKQKETKSLANSLYLAEDTQLLTAQNPRHPLIRQLSRVNKYNADKLSAQLIYALLDYYTPEQIRQNRPIKREHTCQYNEPGTVIMPYTKQNATQKKRPNKMNSLISNGKTHLRLIFKRVYSYIMTVFARFINSKR